MKRVLLLGATGMLGSGVYSVLHKRYRLVLAIKDPHKVALLDKVYGGTRNHEIVPFDAELIYQDFVAKKGCDGNYFSDFLGRIGGIDYAINAVGMTIPFSLKRPELTFFINGALPNIFANAFGEKLIHITTDCVYDGRQGFPYDENSSKSPIDVYGLSKSLGEPAKCLTIRTSIIGRELTGFTGLLEWFLQQDGKSITGFSEHYWNGITTQQFGRICDQIMSSPGVFPRHGIFHVFSTVVSKYEMLLTFQRKYKIRCTINPASENRLNRTLTTVKEFNGLLQMPSFVEMVDALES
jgi:dTDP-4-dehydrorhamnose reductase